MKYISFFFIVLLLTACDDKPADTSNEDFKDEMKSRELKKISDGQIIEAALKRGNMIADTAQKLLSSTLKAKLTEDGVQGAIEFCNLNAYDLIKSLEEDHNVEIKRASLKARNPKDHPTDLEEQLLEAYQYQVENDDKLMANIQRDEKYLLFTRPIVIKDALCLKCHGKPGEYLKTEDYKLIKSLYPQDNAINHQMGDLRGIWSIRLLKSEIVKDI